MQVTPTIQQTCSNMIERQCDEYWTQFPVGIHVNKWDHVHDHLVLKWGKKCTCLFNRCDNDYDRTNHCTHLLCKSAHLLFSTAPDKAPQWCNSPAVPLRGSIKGVERSPLRSSRSGVTCCTTWNRHITSLLNSFSNFIIFILEKSILMLQIE